jgi:hypothetical protein
LFKFLQFFGTQLSRNGNGLSAFISNWEDFKNCRLKLKSMLHVHCSNNFHSVCSFRYRKICPKFLKMSILTMQVYLLVFCFVCPEKIKNKKINKIIKKVFKFFQFFFQIIGSGK